METKLTPQVEVEYPFLFQPDTKFDPDGVYRINLLFDPARNEEHAAFMKALRTEWEPTKGKNKPWKEHKDQDDKPTGKFSVKMKTKYQPKVFDAKTQPINRDSNIIGNGSEVKVAYTTKPYSDNGGGLSLYLQAVQVIKLIEYVPDGGNFGFDETDGYSQTESFEKLFEDAKPEKVDDAASEKPKDLPF